MLVIIFNKKKKQNITLQEMLNLLSTRMLKAFSCKVPVHLVRPQPVLLHMISSLQVLSTWHFLLNSMRLPSAHFSGPSGSLWMEHNSLVHQRGRLAPAHSQALHSYSLTALSPPDSRRGENSMNESEKACGST